MQKTILVSLLVLLYSLTGSAQSDGIMPSHANFGLGISGWGVPIYLSYDMSLMEDINIGGGVSFQTSAENYGYFGGSYKYRHSIIGINGLGYYYFDRMIDAPEQFDVYGGVSAGYYIWNRKYVGDGLGVTYSGNGNGGVGAGLIAGGRYYFKDNLSVNAEVHGGNIMSSLRVGLSWDL